MANHEEQQDYNPEFPEPLRTLRKGGYITMLVTGVPYILSGSEAAGIIWGVGAAVGLGSIVLANILNNREE